MKKIITHDLTSNEQKVEAIRSILKDNPREVIILFDGCLENDSEAQSYLNEVNKIMKEDPIELSFVIPNYAIATLKSEEIDVKEAVESFGKNFLIHWWHHYGKIIYSFEELLIFEEIIDKYGVEKVLDIAAASYVAGDGSPTIFLISIRSDVVEKLFNSMPKFENEKIEKDYQVLKAQFIRVISEAFQIG